MPVGQQYYAAPSLKHVFLLLKILAVLLAPTSLFFKLNLAYLGFWHVTQIRSGLLWRQVVWEALGATCSSATCSSPVPGSQLLEHSSKALQNMGEDHQAGGQGGGTTALVCKTGPAATYLSFPLRLSFLRLPTGAKQKEAEAEWPLWVEKPLEKNLNRDFGSRFASWTLTVTEDSQMAENVYQGLVMGIFSSDIETELKKQSLCVWRFRLALKDCFQTSVWTISSAVCY